jgi:Contact-dependent growth inhibition CdiA C-terminal domain
MGDTSSVPPAVNRARGTTGSAKESGRILSPDDERMFSELVNLHAAGREAFEERYGRGTWLSMTGTVRDAANLLALQHAQDQRRLEEEERARAVAEPNRELQREQEFASFNRGAEAIKASGPGAVVGAAGLAVASERGANVHERADVAEATTQAGDMAATILMMGRGKGRAAAPPPRTGGAGRAGGTPSTESKSLSNKGTSPSERGVPRYPTVVDPDKQPPANENKMGRPANDNSLRSPANDTVPEIQRRPATRSVPVETVVPLKKTGTGGSSASGEDMRTRAARGGRREPPPPRRTPPGQPIPAAPPGSPPPLRPWEVAGRGHLPQGRGPGRGRLTFVGSGFEPEEIEAAQWARDQGLDVVLRNPTGMQSGGGTTDTLINSQLWDIYTPKPGTDMQGIMDGMRAKTKQVGRGSGGVLVNLSKSPISPAQVEQHINNERRKGNNPLGSLRKWTLIRR